MTTTHARTNALGSGDSAGRLVWAAGFVVAAGAAVATAHGLYEVARAAGAPTPIAAVYPVITDGLALVAYATITRLRERAYAWTIVVLAAGLSGLAQAAYLAGGVHTAPPWLRFGVGAWPATAAAIVAHLLYLLAAARPSGAVPATPYNPPVQAYNPLYAPLDAVQPAVQPPPADEPPATPVSPRDRARAAARDHRNREGDLPTVTQLMDLAAVARGTAATALRELRNERPSLQIVTHNEPSTER